MWICWRNANWSGPRVAGMVELMCGVTSLSKYFMITDVRIRPWNNAPWNTVGASGLAGVDLI